jgi:microcystin-dependent protein
MAQTVTIAPSNGHPLLVTQGGVGASPGFDAIDVRRMTLAASSRREGVFDLTGFRVRERAAGVNFTLEVDANVGLARVDGTSVALQGPYIIAPHSAVLALDVTAAHATNPRIDRVILQVRDNTWDGSGSTDARVVILTGTATSGATLDNPLNRPALPVSSLHLADILVRPQTSGDTGVSNARIRDYRLYAGGDADPGDMIFTAATTKVGWSAADGAALNRVVHARLFAATSTRHGAGDGSTTFLKPDMRGRVPVGAGGQTAGRLNALDARGATGGAQTVTLTASESGVADHQHDMATRNAGSQSIATGGNPVGLRSTHGASTVNGTTILKGTDAGFYEELIVSGVNGGGRGASSGHNNLQPSLVEQWMVFTGSVAA